MQRMLALMTEERGAPSALKRAVLLDVYVPALVDGRSGGALACASAIEPRSTIPLFGRASDAFRRSIRCSRRSPRTSRTAGATYRHVASATGVRPRRVRGRPLDEVWPPRWARRGPVPIAVVAERRRLREIRASRLLRHRRHAAEPRSALPRHETTTCRFPQIVAHVLEALRKGAVERVLAGLRRRPPRWVDPTGQVHAKRDGTMAAFISEPRRAHGAPPGRRADDGRTCCLEAVVIRPASASRTPSPPRSRSNAATAGSSASSVSTTNPLSRQPDRRCAPASLQIFPCACFFAAITLTSSALTHPQRVAASEIPAPPASGEDAGDAQAPTPRSERRSAGPLPATRMPHLRAGRHDDRPSSERSRPSPRPKAGLPRRRQVRPHLGEGLHRHLRRGVQVRTFGACTIRPCCHRQRHAFDQVVTDEDKTRLHERAETSCPTA